MQFVDSNKKQLDYGRILHIAHQNESYNDERLKEFEVWMLTVANAIGQAKLEGTIIGNTCFLYRRGPKGHEHQAIVWVLNADTLQNLTKNGVEFITRMMNSGVVEFVARYKNPALTRMLKNIFKQIKHSGDDIQFEKSANGGITAYMVLQGNDHV
jgi:hypothetical protein